MEAASYITTLLVLLVTLFICVYFYIKKKYRYFEERGTPYVKPTFLLGSTIRALTRKETLEDTFSGFYNDHKGEKVIGFFQFLSPTYLAIDPEIIERMLVKDFSCFTDHVGEIDAEINPLDGHLFNLKGQQWKTMRTKLSPIFTSGKIKWMFDQVLACGDNLVEYFNDIATGEDVMYKPVLSSFGLDVIASCTFGLEVKSLKDPNSQFNQMAAKIFKPTFIQGVKMLMRVMFPKVVTSLKLKTIPDDIHDFFFNLTVDAMNERARTNYQRNDFIQLLLQLREKGFVDYDDQIDKDEDHEEQLHDVKSNKYEFTDEALAAQTFIFIVAGHETASVLMAYSLYLLSTHPEVQEKLRNEIKAKVQEQGGLNYDALKHMTYLDCVLSETLRMFPPTIVLMRECTKDFQIDENQIMEKGSMVFIPVSTMQTDERFFDEPTKFIPERFLDSQYSMFKSGGVFLPFGDGPRVCIARRFAILEAKVALSKILLNFGIERSPKNIEPLTRNPKSFTIEPKGGLHIRIKKLNP